MAVPRHALGSTDLIERDYQVMPATDAFALCTFLLGVVFLSCGYESRMCLRHIL
jgi:hypothetical protein